MNRRSRVEGLGGAGDGSRRHGDGAVRLPSSGGREDRPGGTRLRGMSGCCTSPSRKERQ